MNNITKVIEQLEWDRIGLAQQIAAYEKRLDRINTTLEREGYTVLGSRNQTRGHPLLPLQLAIEKQRDRVNARRREADEKLARARDAQAQETLVFRANELMRSRRSTD